MNPTVRSVMWSCVAQCAALGVALGSAQGQAAPPQFERTVFGDAGNWNRYTLDIPAGTSALTVVISGGTGDADLYVRAGEEPTDTLYTCRPYLSTSEETCAITDPSAGTWHIGINGYSAYSDVRVTATWAASAKPDPVPPTPPADPLPPPPPATDWKTQLLTKHNAYRAQHCAPALAWDDAVAATAQDWADGCVWQHATGTGLGENLAGGNLGDAADEPVDRWYAEVANYDFAAPGFSAATGHFTQVVWSESTKLGCGVSTCPASIFGDASATGEALMIVCRYSPPGNMTGGYEANVKPKPANGVCQ